MNTRFPCRQVVKRRETCYNNWQHPSGLVFFAGGAAIRRAKDNLQSLFRPRRRITGHHWLTLGFALLALRWAVNSLSAPSSSPAAQPLPNPKPGGMAQIQAAPAAPMVTPPAPNTTTALPLPAAPPLRAIAPVAPRVIAPPKIAAASAILVDAVSGQVLYARNADAARPMASTTKIMTALLFVQAVPENALITASERASKTRESSLHLKKGEVLTAHDLLRAMLLRSANDGCVAAAEHVAGTEEAFVAQMNAKAKELGCLHTHFMNPHGLHDDLHYTTARDLAIIARAAMQEPRIAETVCTQKCRITRSLDHNDVTLRNHSHFLGKFPGADGIKTGYTRPAGHCYVGSATENGFRLISVVLKSPDYVGETSAMMRYGFAKFAPHILTKAGDAIAVGKVENGAAPEVQAVSKQNLQYLAPKMDANTYTIETHILPLTAPVLAGSVIGTAEILANGKPISSAPLVARDTVPAAEPALLSTSNGKLWTRFLPGAFLFGAGLVFYRYGKRNRNRTYPLTKSARRRRGRFTQNL